MHAVVVVVWSSRPAWFDEAECSGVGPGLFYADPGDEVVNRLARDVCTHCPVRRQCLEYAIANDEHYGIWGGMAPRQRQAIRRGRR